MVEVGRKVFFDVRFLLRLRLLYHGDRLADTGIGVAAKREGSPALLLIGVGIDGKKVGRFMPFRLVFLLVNPIRTFPGTASYILIYDHTEFSAFIFYRYL